MNLLLDRLALTTAVTSAVSGGVLFAFSSFVMPGLRSLPAATAVAAMQEINLAAPRSLFMLPLFGSAVGSLIVGGYGLLAGPHPGRGWLLLGAAAGIASIVITMAYHVPRNNVLAGVDPAGPAAGSAWLDYAAGWTAWNHVRTAAALLSAVALVAETRSQP